MPDPEHLEITIDSHLSLPSAETPRRVLEAMRRHLRQHAATSASGPGASENPLTLIQTHQGQHQMPQGLLPALTDACRRQGVTYTVVDRRTMVACPALRSRRRLSDEEREAVRRLLLRDSGVLVAPPAAARAVALELLSRRQQRTLIATQSASESERWLAELRESLGLPAPLVEQLRLAGAETRIAVGRYHGILQLPPEQLRADFGMVIFDGLAEVDALTLMKIVRGVGAHYLLGLSASSTRADGLQGTLFLALGGVTHTLATPAPVSAPLRLGCRFRPTGFRFDYQGRSQYQALVAGLARDEERGRLVAADLLQEVEAGQACLVLSERRDHLEQLAALLPPELPLEVLTSTVRPADRSRILRSFEEGELRILLATGQIASEAVSSSRASRLFLTFPFAYVRKLEAVIRLLLQPAPGKSDAVIFDYDDQLVVPLHRAFEKRRLFLERLCREAEEQAARQAQMQLPLP